MGLVVVEDLGSEEHGPELVIGGGGEGGGGGVDGDVAIPVAQDVCRLEEPRVLVGERAVVEGVGQALGDEQIELGVDVHLDVQHVRGGKRVVGGDGGFEEMVDALDAVGVGPVAGDGVGVVVGGDAGVGGGEDAGGGVEDGGELVVGDVAGPGLGEVEGVDGDEGEGGADGVGLRGRRELRGGRCGGCGRDFEASGSFGCAALRSG